MDDIFISYSRADTAVASRVAHQLESAGYSVFWDRTIPAGSSWRDVTGAALDGARAVVVIWSPDSVVSRWVMEEADRALARKALVPIAIDNIQPPLGFASVQFADLSDWAAGGGNLAFDKFLVDLSSFISASHADWESPSLLKAVDKFNDEKEPDAVSSFDQSKSQTSKRTPLTILSIGAVVLTSGIGFFLFNSATGGSTAEPSAGDQTKKLQVTTEAGLVTDGGYYWILNGDGSRNWFEAAPRCRQDATRMQRTKIDANISRHNGEGSAGYSLKEADAVLICNNPRGIQPKLLTDRAYYWLINSDGSRNWIADQHVSSQCVLNAKVSSLSAIEQYPKRHDGEAGYTLKGEDASRACALQN